MKRYSKKEKKKIILSLIIPLIFALIISIVGSIYVLRKPHFKSIKNEKKDPIIMNYDFSFIAVGDALIHDGVYKDAKTNKKDESGYTLYDFKDMFSEIKDVVKDYDLKFYNQETIIGGKSIGLSTYPCFNSPDEVALDMIDAGFNIVNLATNHTLDRGEKAILYSRKFWKDQEMLSRSMSASASSSSENASSSSLRSAPLPNASSRALFTEASSAAGA